MHPYQKYPSAYKGYPPQYSQDQVPQSPFDVAYGSSLLPRQLLVSSPFVQVPSPLPSPIHHSYSYQRSQGGAPQHPHYMVAPPVPKLSLPPESARRRGTRHGSIINHGNKEQQHEFANGSDTPSKSKYKSMSSSTSSLDESTFDIQLNQVNNEEAQHLYANAGNQSSSSSLYQSFSNYSNAPVSSSSTLQISKTPTRSLVLSNIDPGLSISNFLDFITFGPIENSRIVENFPEEGSSSIVLTFLKTEICLNFYNNLLTYLSTFKKLINSPGLAINFILCKKLLPFISNAINNDGATRNVYIGDIGSLEKPITKEYLTSEFAKFGIIDKIDIVQKNQQPTTSDDDDKEVQEETDDLDSSETKDAFAFIHFTNIASAIKAVEQLSLNPNWQACKIFYGTDRCSVQNDQFLKSITDESTPNEMDDADLDIIGTPVMNSAKPYFVNDQYIQEEDEDGENMSTIHHFYPNHHAPHQQFLNSEEDISVALNQRNVTAIRVASDAGGARNIGNRTICLSNLDAKTKVEDICNVVRGGVLQLIKFFPSKKVCFLTFIEDTAAAQFFANTHINPITLHSRRLKVGWGNHSGPLPNSIALAVTVGASRNVYIGIKEEDIDEPKADLPSEEILRKDFSKFGEIEQINYLKTNRCVFLNFLNISHAIKVVDDSNGVNSDDFHAYFEGRYEHFKISFGKDRCGNPPKAKKKKKKKKRALRLLDQQQQDEQENDEADDSLDRDELIASENAQVEEVPADLLASMSISKKDEENSAFGLINGTSETTESSNKMTNAFGITESTKDNDVDDKEKEEVKDSVEAVAKGSKGKTEDDLNDEGYDTVSSSEMELAKSRPYTPTRISSDDFNHRLNSKRPQSNRSTSNYKKKSHSNSRQQQQQQQHYPHPHPGQFTPPIGTSRVSSHASLNSLYYGPEADQLYYKSVPFAPPFIAHTKSRSNSYQQQQPTHFVPQGQFGGYSTNGSQVMAQYLAQSQHANLVYAANVLNTADDYSEEDYFSRGGGGRRYKK